LQNNSEFFPTFYQTFQGARIITEDLRIYQKKPRDNEVLKMRLNIFKIIAMTICLPLAFPDSLLAGGWGIERGRANEGDIARLAVDKVAIARATKQIDAALTRAVAIERQKALLGMTDIEVQVSNARIAQVNEEAEKWFIESVLEPAEAILENPAASCEEAKRANTSLLGMIRQKALLGLNGRSKKPNVRIIREGINPLSPRRPWTNASRPDGLTRSLRLRSQPLTTTQ
jgi:hypothetical protein